MTDEPTLQLEEGRRLLDDGDFDGAIRVLSPLTGRPDPNLAGDAWLAIGTARYRADDEEGALAAWQAAANLGGRNAWLGWRSVAEQLVRDGDLESAISAYREADRRAPAAERGAIANRIAWLLKETGHDFAARRQFNRARGAYATTTPIVSYALIAINVVVFGIDAIVTQGASIGSGFLLPQGPEAEPLLLPAFAVNGYLVAIGEWWRILTSAFVHLGIVHLLFNMLALYIFGGLAERMYGPFEYLLIYLLSAAGGSVLTILVEPSQSAAGASGAIFGIIGLIFVSSRRHHTATAAGGRVPISTIGPGFLLYLLAFTFLVPGISWTGHLGGLFTGAALGFLLPPTGVMTLSAIWRTPSGEHLHRAMPLIARAGVYVGVAAVLFIGSYLAVARLVG